MSDEQGLTKRERQVMDALFQLGEGSAAQVHLRLPDPPTYTAVRTMLKLMEDKGLVQHREEGRKYIYRPKQSSTKEGKGALGRVLRVFFGGSLENAIAAHLNDPAMRLDSEEAARLHALIDQASNSTKVTANKAKEIMTKSNWLCSFAASMALAISLVSTLPAEDIVGQVTDQDQRPLANIRVTVAAAAYRNGPSIYSDNCFSDCAKWTTTNADAAFVLNDVNPDVKFRLAFSAKRYQTRLSDWIEIANGKYSISLQEKPEFRQNEKVVYGRVFSESGAAIQGALIAPMGGKKVDGMRWGGRTPGVEVCVSDENGEFAMELTADMTAVDINVLAYGHCGSHLSLLKPGDARQDIVVPIGAMVSGKLVWLNDVPAPNLIVAVAQADRSASRLFVRAIPCQSSPDGRFEFKNLPPDELYCLYSVVGDVRSKNNNKIITTKQFRAPGSGTVRDLGALKVENSIAVHGRVQAVDDTPIPENLKLYFGRDPAWDSIAVAVEKDGSFAIDQLPPETYEISFRTPELRIDSNLLQFQAINDKTFGLRLRNPIDNLILPVRRANVEVQKPK